MKNKPSIQWYIDRYVFPEPNTGCWLWAGSTYRRGYGRAGKQGPAHRLFYEHFVEPIIGDNYVCHHCDNPSCVNPQHLFQGTCKDNVQDMIKKNRQAKGETSGTHVLTEDRVREIVKLSLTTSPSKIANYFNVNRTVIHKILCGEIWSHLTGIARKPVRNRSETFKLKPDQVLAIRDKHSKGVSYSQLMSEYGVSRANISLIINRINWTHL